MSRERRPRPTRRWLLSQGLRDILGQVQTILTMALALALVGIVAPPPVTSECPGGEVRPVVVVAGVDGRTVPELEANVARVADTKSGLTRANVVGRDGIEPPTLRFSAARSTD
jgi:hypothetical protein